MQQSFSDHRCFFFDRGRCLPLLVLLIFLGIGTPAVAHNPPEEYYDRNITVSLEPACVRVHYRLELSQVSLFSLKKDDAIKNQPINSRATLETACLNRFKVTIPDGFVASLNDQPLNWTIEKTRVDPQDSSHFHLHLRCDWRPRNGVNRFEISDATFNGVPGPYRLKVDVAEEFMIGEIVEPVEWQRKTPDPREERKALVVFRPIEGFADQEHQAAPLKEEPPPPPRSFWDLMSSGDLKSLLATNYGLGLLLLIALIHGAGHSLMPGHGKTMVAAYLVGERGTPRHAILLGVVTTLTHTSAALAIAILLHYVLPQNSEAGLNTVLKFLGGLLIASIGFWLFLQRLAGKSDHVHLFDLGHGHSHGGPAPAVEPMSGVRLILLGVAGGIIPCWGAIMWVIGCIATSQFWLALPVVLSFSIGLASVLILIGLSVVYAGRIGQSRFGERAWFRAIFNERTRRVMPVVGAALVVVIGLFFCATSGIASK